MQYKKSEAKQYAKQHFTGVWAANLTPFDVNGRFDEEAFKANLKHWLEDLQLSGLFICGKQAEFFSMTLAERKRQILLSVEAAAAVNTNAALVGKRARETGTTGRAQIIASISDVNLETVLELGRYAKDVGADYVIAHSPVLHFGADTEETIYEYYRYLCEELDIGVAMWNHPDCGYTMSPELCNRIADLPNIVAIKYSAPREKYAQLTQLAGHKIQVSNPSEDEWLDNIEELGWRLYLCSTPPFLLQTKTDRRVNEYTRLAFAGDFARARKVRDSLNPMREAFAVSKPKGKPQAHAKVWQDLLGQTGGKVKRPLLNLTDVEIANTHAAYQRL